MKLKVLIAFIAVGILTVTGCVNTLDGRTRGGSPFGKDKIESRYERPTDAVFTAAKAVLSFNGTLDGENTISKTVWAKVDTRTVWVKVDEVEPKVTRVIVQVRTKNGGADIALASEIDKQIALKLVQ